jgi:type I restriction enzyme S subunit
MAAVTDMLKYDVYIDSGIEWLGLMPEHWQLKKFKYCFNKSNAGEVIDKSFWGEGSELLYTCKRTPMKSNYKKFESRRRTEENDLLLTRNGTPYVHLPQCDSIYSNVVQRVGLHPNYFKKFIWYSLSNSALYLGGYGDIIESFNMSTWKELSITVPDYDTQVLIVDFLDQRTSLIDQAIAIKEKQIALLKEREQTLIQKAVTQGLNADVPMINSGLDWAGDIPKHWEVIRLKHLFKEVNKRTKTGEETLFSLRMIVGLVPHNDVSEKHIPCKNLVDYKIVDSGQLVMNRMRAAIGIFGIASDYGLVSPDYAVFDICDGVISEYYLTLFKLPLMGTQFRLASKGMGTGSSGFMRLYTDSFGNIKVPFPPKEEQKQLYDYILGVSKRTSESIVHFQEQVEKLKEYRRTLINSVVTGKIKMPEAM